VETDSRLCDVLKTGMEVEVDMEKDVLTDLSSGKTYNLKSLGDVGCMHILLYARGFLYMYFALHKLLTIELLLQAGPVIDAGGLFDFARKTGMIKSAN
jgi:3-isopropylmalate/(R)-2-methylmalate dehydratase small subunit